MTATIEKTTTSPSLLSRIKNAKSDLFYCLQKLVQQEADDLLTMIASTEYKVFDPLATYTDPSGKEHGTIGNILEVDMGKRDQIVQDIYKCAANEQYMYKEELLAFSMAYINIKAEDEHANVWLDNAKRMILLVFGGQANIVNF